jgi:hypothetical protein
LPAGHGTHAQYCRFCWNLPDGHVHVWHPVDCTMEVYFPPGQLLQGDFSSHDMPSSVENFPMSQIVPQFSPAVIITTAVWPTGHFMHFCWPGFGW